MKKSKLEHVVVDFSRNGALVCLHCNEKYEQQYPLPLDLFLVFLGKKIFVSIGASYIQKIVTINVWLLLMF